MSRSRGRHFLPRQTYPLKEAAWGERGSSRRAVKPQHAASVTKATRLRTRRNRTGSLLSESTDLGCDTALYLVTNQDHTVLEQELVCGLCLEHCAVLSD